MELAHWADHTETRLGLTKRAPVPGAEGTQVLTKLRSAPLRFCLLHAQVEGKRRSCQYQTPAIQPPRGWIQSLHT